MSEIRTFNFNTQPLLNEIDNVIKRGLSNILQDFVNRYELLENTHKQIMNLPSVVNELNGNYQFDNDSKTDEAIFCSDEEADKTIFTSIHDMTHDMVKDEIFNIEKKLEMLENKYDAIIPVLNKLANVIQTLGDDVKQIKNTPVLSEEKENIKLIIEDQVEEESDEEEQAEEEEEEEDEQEEEQEEEEAEEQAEEQEEEEEAEEQAEEEQEEEEAEEQAEEEQEEEEAEEQAEDEEEEEIFEIEIDDVTYCTNNEDNGFIYELTEDGEQGEKVGYLKDGEPFFYADEN